MKDAISIIKNAGGVPILAHPGVYKKKDSLELIGAFTKLGGRGIETYYPYHLICPDLKIGRKENNNLVKFYQKIAASHKLFESGGSDFHGTDRDTLGKIAVPDKVLLHLKSAVE